MIYVPSLSLSYLTLSTNQSTFVSVNAIPKKLYYYGKFYIAECYVTKRGRGYAHNMLATVKCLN